MAITKAATAPARLHGPGLSSAAMPNSVAIVADPRNAAAAICQLRQRSDSKRSSQEQSRCQHHHLRQLPVRMPRGILGSEP